MSGFLKRDSICAFAGVLYKNKNVFEEHVEAAKKELTQLICELGLEELLAVVKVEEPQTFKIGEDDLPLEVSRKLDLR